MPSVDVVSKVDLQALDNAINNVKREISTRFDFKNVKSEITFDRKAKYIHIVTGDDWKVKTITEMLIGQCTRLKVDPKCLDLKEIEPTSHVTVKMDILIKEGIPRETCQKIVKLIKGLKIKVQSAIQDDQVRIAAKADTIAQNRYNVTKERFLIGNVDVLDLNIALTERDAATRNYLSTLHNYWTYYYNIRKLTLYDFEVLAPLGEDFDTLVE